MPEVKDHKSHISTDPFRNFKFVVQIRHEIPGVMTNSEFLTMGFMAVSGMNVSNEVIPYREGGSNTSTRKLPGQSNYSDLTLTRGTVFNGHQGWYWMKQLFFVNQGGGFGTATSNFRSNVDIYVMHHPMNSGGASGSASAGTSTGTVQPARMYFRVYNAWPSSLSFSDLDAGGNAVLVNQMVLAHEGWDVKWSTSLSTNAATDLGDFAQ